MEGGKPIIWQDICQNLHENEIIWTEKGAHVPSVPTLLDPPLKCLVHEWFIFLPSATELRKGYGFTGVCHSVHRGMYPSMHWGRQPPGQTPPTATAADGTHPTGMHSCFGYFFTISNSVTSGRSDKCRSRLSVSTFVGVNYLMKKRGTVLLNNLYLYNLNSDNS